MKPTFLDALKDKGYVQSEDGSWHKPRRPDSDTLKAEYLELGTLREVGVIHGVCPQTILNWFNDLGIQEILNQRDWTTDEDNALRSYYSAHTTSESFNLKELAFQMNRTYAALAIRAGRLGLTTRKRRPKEQPSERELRRREWGSKTDEEKFFIRSERIKTAIKKYGHARGMLGKHHTEQTKRKLSKSGLNRNVPLERVIRSMKTRLERYGSALPLPFKRGNWKSGWVEVGGKKFFARSKWEANYGRYLQFLKEAGQVTDWEHEPETFWFDGIKRGCVSYLPDFKVIFWSNEVEYHEVKGWMDQRSKTTIRRMAKYHPEVKLIVIDSTRYKEIAKTARSVVRGWVA